MALSFEALTGILALNTGPWSLGIRQVMGSVGQLQQNFAVASRRIAAVAQQASMAIGGISMAVGAGSLSLVKLASNAEEAASKFGFVFKDAAERTGAAMDDFAKRAGRSRYEMRDMAADLGALIGPMGFTSTETGRLAGEFAKLAVDLSSFFNVSESDALMALRAGVVGEAEPLRRLGVQISEVAVQQEAFRLKLVKTKDAITPMIKTQAIYSLIMKQTAQAQNDAERTSGSYANQVRRVKSAVLDLATDVGNGLLPAFTETLKIFDGVIASFGEMKPQIVDFLKANLSIERVDDIWEGVFTVVDRVRGAFTNVGTAAVQLVRRFDPIRQRLEFVYDRGKQLFDSMPGWAKDLLVVGGTLGGISTALGSFGLLLGPFGQVFGVLGGLLNPLKLIGMAASIVGPLLSSMFLPIAPIIAAVAAAVYMAYDAISSNATAAAAWEHIQELAGELWQGLKDIAGMLAGEWSKAWADGNGELGEFSRSIGTSLLVMLETAMGWFKQIAPYVKDFVVGAFNAAKEAVGALSGVLEFASDIVMGNYAAAWLKILKLVSKVLDALDYADQALGGSGIQIAKDVADLVKQVQAEADAAKKVKQDMADAALQQNDVEKKVFAEEVIRNRERAEQAQQILDKMRESGAAKTKVGSEQAKNLQGIIAESRRAEAAGVQKIFDARKAAAAHGAEPPQVNNPLAASPAPGPVSAAPQPDEAEELGEVNERGERRRKTAKQLADIARKREKEAAEAAKKAEEAAAEQSKKGASRAGVSRAEPRHGAHPAAGHAPPPSPAASGEGGGGHAGAGHVEADVKAAGKAVYDTTTGMAGDLDRLMNRSAVGISDVAFATASAMSRVVKEARKAGEIAPAQMRSLQMAKDAATQAMMAIGAATGEQRKQAIADAAAEQRAFEDAFDKITKRGKYAMENLTESEKRLEEAGKKTAQSIAADARAERQARLTGIDPSQQAAAGQQGQPDPNDPDAGKAIRGQTPPPGPPAKKSANGPRTFGMGDLVGGITNMANGMSAMFAAGMGPTRDKEGNVTGGGLDLGGFGFIADSIKDPVKKIVAEIERVKASIGTLMQNFRPTDRSSFLTIQDLQKQLTGLEGRKRRAQAAERMTQHRAMGEANKQFRENQIAAKGQVMAALRESGLDGMIKEIGSQGAINSAGAGMVVNFHGITDWRTAWDKFNAEARRRGFELGAKRTMEVRHVPG